MDKAELVKRIKTVLALIVNGGEFFSRCWDAGLNATMVEAMAEKIETLLNGASVSKCYDRWVEECRETYHDIAMKALERIKDKTSIR